MANRINTWDGIVKSYRAKRRYDKHFFEVLKNPSKVELIEVHKTIKKKQIFDNSFYRRFDAYIKEIENYN